MPAVPVETNPATNAIFRKTKMCKFYMAGRCTRKDACMFAHSAAELAPLPDFHFTKMCPAIEMGGRCDRGSACTFAHKLSELRAPRKGGAVQNIKAPVAPSSRPPPPEDWMRAVPPPPPAPAPTSAPLATTPMPTLATTPTTLVAAPSQKLISTQRVLAGMGVVLLQVLPTPHTVCDEQAPSAANHMAHLEQSDADVDDGISEGDLDLDLDFSMCEKPSGAWSRQSTEEGFEEPQGDFSRQSSEESVWGLEESLGAPGKTEEAAELSTDGDDGDSEEPPSERSHWHSESSPCGLEAEEETAEQGEGRLGQAFAGDGLAYLVKNTFLQFEDREEPLPPVRRALSTGGCGVRSA